MAVVGQVTRPIMAGEKHEARMPRAAVIRQVTAGFTFRANGLGAVLRQTGQAMSKMAKDMRRFEEQMQQVADAANMTPDQVRRTLEQLRRRTEDGE